MDRTDRIIHEIQNMLNDNKIEPEHVEQVKQVIGGIQTGQVNINHYQRHDADPVIKEAITKAIEKISKQDHEEKIKMLEQHGFCYAGDRFIHESKPNKEIWCSDVKKMTIGEIEKMVSLFKIGK
jgi:hypothetical protein